MKYLLLLLPFVVMVSSPETPIAGRNFFVENCASCHGVTGRGDGPLSRRLATSPADLTKIAQRRDGVWPVLEVMSILDGYFKNTLQREDMPVFEDFLDIDMIEFDTGNGLTTLVPTKLLEMAFYLETLQDPAPTRYVP